MRGGWLLAGLCSVGLVLSSPARAQSPRVLYTWADTGDVRMWVQAFGDNNLVLENTTAGELTITENGAPGAAAAVRDDFNVIAEGGPSIGGLDLTGLSALEFDIGHDGGDPIPVQFFVQATPAFTFLALGPDQEVMPGVSTYVAPLDGLTPDQIAYIRSIGVSFRDHPEAENVIWTIREVRSAGEPLRERDFATHEPGASDGGLQGAVVNFDQAAVEGNDGAQNQSGLSQNTDEPPAGNSGSLHWVDLASGQGAAITWCNGIAWAGDTFNERPTDLSNYQRIIIRMAAANLVEGAVQSVGVQYFLQSGNFQFHQAGPVQSLPADGEFHELEFPIEAIPNLASVETHGINLQNHSTGDLAMDVDFVRAIALDQFPDCNGNRIPDASDLAQGTSKDCNLNSLPDECDITSNASADCDVNGVPDECDIAPAPVERVLYTWNGTGDVRGWIKNFGSNDVLMENAIEGELTATEVGATPGAGWIWSDNFGVVAEDTGSTGGLDVTAMTDLAFDIGHGGIEPIAVQFFVQATPGFQYVSLGPDQAVPPGVSTFHAPLGVLDRAQAAHVLSIGVNIRDHLGEGNLAWTLREIRMSGRPLSRRDFATHDPGTTDDGLQGAVVIGDFAAVKDNDGFANQSGLRQNLSPLPAGNKGSLEWVDLAARGGGAVAWYNGTAFGGSNNNERSSDMSPYQELVVRVAATNLTPGGVASVGVVGYLDTDNFNRHQAGDRQELPADGKFHDLVFPIGDIPGRAYVDQFVLDLEEHEGGDLVIDVDLVQALSRAPAPGDCNANRIPDKCDIQGGVLTDKDGDLIPDECESAEPSFRRADGNSDGTVDLSDAVHTFAYLFLGGALPLCFDASDSNDDNALDITDGVYSLTFQFLAGPPIPPPGIDACGPDPTPSSLGPCEYPSESCR